MFPKSWVVVRRQVPQGSWCALGNMNSVTSMHLHPRWAVVELVVSKGQLVVVAQKLEQQLRK